MTPTGTATEDVDVVVVGAGLSGIGAACHLRRDAPGESVVVLEARERLGGTWDLFRYPGVRSDSDMFTLGYAFRPWRGATAIAAGADILDYLRATAEEHGVDRLIRYGHRVVTAAWSSKEARWRLTVAGPDGETTLRCRFLWVCGGYYRYDHGYAPTFPGQESYAGRLVHPQQWPDDLDPAGAEVVVVGSGATAVTLVPALAERGAHVRMVQRSPSYVGTLHRDDPWATRLAGRLPAPVIARLLRTRSIALQTVIYLTSRRRPDLIRTPLLRNVARRLPPGYDVATHFTPRYEPWDQRLCLSPDGDLFAAISSGAAEVVTDPLAGFTPTGVRLASGRELDADVVVLATGLELLALGGIALEVDGRPFDPAGALAYKGLMLAGVPNLAFTVGYAAASWTLRADLVAGWVTRLLRRMRRRGLATATPRPPVGIGPEQRRPLIDLTSGYVRRGGALLPQQGPRRPWRLPQNHVGDRWLLRVGPLADGIDFTPTPAAGAAATEQQEESRAGVPVR